MIISIHLTDFHQIIISVRKCLDRSLIMFLNAFRGSTCCWIADILQRDILHVAVVVLLDNDNGPGIGPSLLGISSWRQRK